MTKIGKVQRVPLREVWENEATGFTQWLADNIEVLGDVIGLELTDLETEKRSEHFRVDIRAKDENDDVVVIENQYGGSNHDHLGKLLTYLVAHNAKKAVWIVEDARPEHTDAVTWLDTKERDCDFYLIKAEAIKIDDSSPALLLTKIVGPNPQKKEIQKYDSEYGERRARFKKVLLTEAQKHTEHEVELAQFTAVYFYPGDDEDVWYEYAVHKRGIMVALKCPEAMYDALHNEKENVEEAFGEDLKWKKYASRSTCVIRKWLDGGGAKSDEEYWAQLISDAVETMKKLEAATAPIINNL